MDNKYKIPYINACIRAFAKRFSLSGQSAFEYLYNFKGIHFLVEFYEIKHLQSTMILYHGTNVDFDVIDLIKSNKYKDFGQGFYLTDIRSQAEELATKNPIFLAVIDSVK
ncbi:MAG: DUF3990 domain-containing protein [Bacteroidales bacterium]|nr:DUF3990 domain-containing protein [Bacteroidales bacterium]